MNKMYLILLLLISSTIFAQNINFTNKTYLNVALVNISTEYNPNDIPYIKEALEKAGYSVTTKYLDQHISRFGYSDPDSIRFKYFLEAMLDNKIDIIWFIKGGGGAFNIIPDLYKNIKPLEATKPKVLIGFSDVTAAEYFVNNVLDWKSIYGVLAGINENVDKEENNNDITVNYKQPVPNVKKIMYNGIIYNNLIAFNKDAKNGVKGKLIGGNLTVTFAFLSTIYQPDFSKKILILEDNNTSVKHLDRELHQLLYMKINKPAAIIFGQFYPLNATNSEKLTYSSLIKNFAKVYNRPVYYFPYFGHGKVNFPLLLGQRSSISCPKKNVYCQLDN